MNSAHFPAIDMNLLRVFHAVYIEKNVSLAAIRLGVTQSAVSHGLRKLRELFDDQLFIRSAQAMVPTVRAQTLFEPVKLIMETLTDQVLAESVFDAAAAKREFSLVMGDMAEVVFLPPLLRHMREYAPHCTMRTQRMRNEAMMDALERGDAEIALGNMPEAHGSFYSQTMFQHDYVVLASSDHRRIGSSLSWKEYAREEHIVVASGLDSNLEQKTLAPRGIKRKVVLTVSGFLTVPWLVQGTELLATVPTRLSQTIARAANVKQLKMPTPVEPYGLQSVWHPRWHKDPGHRWLRETLFTMMQRYPDIG
jgi:DNA-binding transcriptional LysR family regulator